MSEPRNDLPPVPPSLQTVMVPIERVKRYTRNPRKKQNVEKMRASLDRYGWRQPIVVDGEYEIIVGDTRYLGAQARGDTHVPVWVAADLTPEQVHGYRFADNRIAEESDWDADALSEELKLLQELGFSDIHDLEDVTGFDEEELKRYLGDDAEGHQLVPVEVAEFPAWTWVLIGVPTSRYVEIAEAVEAISHEQEFFCEVTYNDERPKK